MKIYMDKNGYAEYFFRDIDGERCRVYEHRLLMFAWGYLDSPFFNGDMQEIHHYDNPKWLNIEENLVALSPKEHMNIDPERAKIVTPWDKAIAGD